MLRPCVCGTFHHEDDDNPLLVSHGFSSRKSKRKNENPYATRGLDKFSELLAVLDEKRQKIYSEMNPNDISFVRFVYSNTDDFVPIVVKVKNKDHHKQHRSSEELRVVKARNLTPSMEKSTIESNAAIVKHRKQQPKLELEAMESMKNFSWNMKKWEIWKPCFYVPIVIILILMLLTMFGRSFATLWTCVLWYIIPALKDRSSLNPRKSMQKKDYVKGLSEKKIVVNEGMKKKDYIRRWSEKKIQTEGLVSLTSNHSPEASKNYKSTIAKHGYKKSW